jgi:hypothetical protein
MCDSGSQVCIGISKMTNTSQQEFDFHRPGSMDDDLIRPVESIEA